MNIDKIFNLIITIIILAYSLVHKAGHRIQYPGQNSKNEFSDIDRFLIRKLGVYYLNDFSSLSDHRRNTVDIRPETFVKFSIIFDDRHGDMFKKAATELLAVRKDDKQSVLRISTQNHERIKSALLSLPFFQHWSPDAINQACILSRIKLFLPGSIIAGQNDVSTDNSGEYHRLSYFILEGTCRVIQKIVFRVGKDFKNRPIFKLRKNQNLQNETVDTKFVFFNVLVLYGGDCFGLGEDLTNRWITSVNAVRCLLMPTEYLFCRHNESNIWTMTLNCLNNSFPLLSEIEDRLFLRFKWYRYKRQLYDSSDRRKMNISTTLEDVPLYWRINRQLPTNIAQMDLNKQRAVLRSDKTTIGRSSGDWK